MRGPSGIKDPGCYDESVPKTTIGRGSLLKLREHVPVYGEAN
jgi:hypothetical protein